MDTPLPEQSVSLSPKPSKTNAIIILVLVLFGFTASFVGGFFTHQFLFPKDAPPPVVPSPPPQPAPVTPPVSTGVVQDTTRYLPGKHFYDEGFYVLTKDSPHLVLLLSTTRSENATGSYSQSTRASLITPDVQTRITDSSSAKDSAIVTDKIIRSWQTTIDPSRVLREQSRMDVLVNSTVYQIDTGPLTNELAIRSLPGYTKFFSNGNGTITFDNQIHPAHVLYYRLYSQNAADLQFYTQPLGLTTDLIVFYDQNNNLYLMDSSEVDRPVNDYKTHKIAFFEDGVTGAVSKTFSANIVRDSVKLPHHYDITFDSPLNATLSLSLVNSLNKAPNTSYDWYLTSLSGFVQKANGEKLTGFGIGEYIHD